MFTQERSTVEGTHHRVQDALNNPRPIRGDIPIMIGGSGEKKTLRMVAQYADASNFFGDAERMRHLIGVLEGHCERLGRDPAEITKTRLGTILIAPTAEEAERRLEALRRRGVSEGTLATMVAGDPDAVGERVTALLDAGVDALIFNTPFAHDLEMVALIGETLGPLLAERAAA
jgi:alkanesulfonate monooxygenase SsuD/methylene tetrahydromethanopterin reductase-like flavin-dependent oxidoreductase (luciferase family)